jgi:aminopeptidase
MKKLSAIVMLVLFVPCLVSGQAAAEPENKSQTISATATATAARGYEDPRLRRFAEILVNYSVDLKKGEKILLYVLNENAVPLAKAIVDEAYRAGGIPFVDMADERLERALYMGTTAERFQLIAKWDSVKYGLMDAYIRLLGADNISELSDVPAEQINLGTKHWKGPIWRKIVLTKLKWCDIRYPSAAMAQSAGMSTEAFTDFYFRVCTLDYARLAKAMEPLIRLMKATDKVRIVGPGTDLTISIKNIPALAESGHFNVPDGEAFTAPVKNSVNGVLAIHLPCTWEGVFYRDIRFKFKDGKIIKATANFTEQLNQVLDIDEGARYLGEFAFGVNPYIEKPMNNLLFDEKIAMSFHLAVGDSFPDADNGNHSALHWDLVCIQSPEYGGGEIWFDGKLVRKDGKFVLPELLGLNPENLK